MSTIREIITQGFREAGIIAVGDSPDANEYDEAFGRLEKIIQSVIGNQFGDKLLTVGYGVQGLTTAASKAQDVSELIDTSYIPLNSRVVFNNEADATVYLHPNPQDGSRLSVIDNAGNFASNSVILNGNGRRIEDASSVTLSTNSLQRSWFYRADLGNWERVTDIDSDQQSPFAPDFDDYLSILLAMRLNPRYGAETKAETGEFLRRYERQFRSRYRQTVEVEVDEALLRVGEWDSVYGSYRSDTDRFNSGN